MLKILVSIVSLSAVALSAQAASSYTYTYNGPLFPGGTDHVSASFTTAGPLAPSTSYLDKTSAGVTASAIWVAGPTGRARGGLILPITTFQVHTDETGAVDSWFLFGDLNTLAGVAPTMTGTDWQAYTINTLAFIPGSDIGGVGLVTGRYDYDQATETTFYASCTAVVNCTLAGNGQPYVANYGGIINPSNTSGGAPWWSVTTKAITRRPTKHPERHTGRTWEVAS
jgi:hypothetical protein